MKTKNLKQSWKSDQGFITLVPNGNYYRANLSKSLIGKRTYISLGIKNKPENIVKGVGLINKIETLILEDIKLNSVDLTLEKYTPKSIQEVETLKTVWEYIEIYKKNYFINKKKNSQTETTLANAIYDMQNRYFKKYLHYGLNVQTMETILLQYKYGTDKRDRCGAYLGRLINNISEIKQHTEEHKFELTKYIGGYEAPDEKLPTDEEIIDIINKVGEVANQTNKWRTRGDSWSWMVGVLATYGLRSHELLAIKFDESFNPPDYALVLDETLCEGTKTGNRIIPPLPPEWVEFFNLTAIKNPEQFKLLTVNMMNSTPRGYYPLHQQISARFRYRKIRHKKEGYRPGHLRHCYAIRGHVMGVDNCYMADYMGHTEVIHNKTYKRFITNEDRLKPFRDAMLRQEENKRIRNGELSYVELEDKTKTLEAQLSLMKVENEGLSKRYHQLRIEKNIRDTLKGNKPTSKDNPDIEN